MFLRHLDESEKHEKDIWIVFQNPNENRCKKSRGGHELLYILWGIYKGQKLVLM